MSARVRALRGEEVAARLEALVEVLLDCVEGGASVGFMLPLSRERARRFWEGVAASAARGERVVVVAEDEAGTVVGTAQLVLAMPDNQPHRGDVAKMLVRRAARRQGLARRLLEVVEAEARAAGKTVLVLDTVTHGAAWHLYQACGWQRVGDIPNYALMPDGPRCSTTYFHKQL